MQLEGPWFPDELSVPGLTSDPVTANMLAKTFVGAPPYSYNLDCGQAYGALGLPLDWNLSAPPPPGYCDFGKGPQSSGNDPAFSIWDSQALPTGAIVVANDSPAGFNGAIGSCIPAGGLADYDCGARTISTLDLCANDTQPPSLEPVVNCPGWFSVYLTVTLSSWDNGTIEASATPVCGGGGCPGDFCSGVGCQPQPLPVLYDWFVYSCPSVEAGSTSAPSTCTASTPYRNDFPLQDLPPDSESPSSNPGWTEAARDSAGFSWQLDEATSRPDCSVYLRSFYVGVYAGWSLSGAGYSTQYVAMSAIQLENAPVIVGSPGCAAAGPTHPPGSLGGAPAGWPPWLPWPWTLPAVTAVGIGATVVAIRARGPPRRSRKLVTPGGFGPPGPR
jgi:hypothetical protein